MFKYPLHDHSSEEALNLVFRETIDGCMAGDSLKAGDEKVNQ